MPTTVQSAEPSTERSCLGCGYSLRGLGDEPRCPECGLLNIPQGYREEVWRLVDSSKWFFSSFFGPFKKRPPGWWWALDRPEDVRRSLWYVACNILLSALVLFLATMVCGLFQIEFVSQYLAVDQAHREQPVIPCGRISSWVGTFHSESDPPMEKMDWAPLKEQQKAGRRIQIVQSKKLVIRPSYGDGEPAGGYFIVGALLWLVPAIVGLTTQIRKGLPPFACARRTVVVAANYESHMVVFSALLFSFLLIIYTLSLLGGILPSNSSSAVWFTVFAAFIAFGAVRWVGPLRSDYTGRLIRSRWHATRIILMYAVLPWLSLLGIAVYLANG